MGLLDKLFGKKQDSTDIKVEPTATVETKVVPKEEDVGVPADGDQVVRGE
jgi:hypothetical protein